MVRANMVYIGRARGWVPVDHDHGPECGALRFGDHLMMVGTDQEGRVQLAIEGLPVGQIPEPSASAFRDALMILHPADVEMRVRGKVVEHGDSHLIMFEDAEPDELRRWAQRIARRAGGHGFGMSGKMMSWGLLAVCLTSTFTGVEAVSIVSAEHDRPATTQSSTRCPDPSTPTAHP